MINSGKQTVASSRSETQSGAAGSTGSSAPASSPTATDNDSVRSGWHLPTMLAALAAAALEFLLVAAAIQFALPLYVILLSHGAVIGGLAIWVWRLHRQRRDVSNGLLLLLSTMAVGPLGALGSSVYLVFSELGREDMDLLASWYDRISNSARIDDVSRHCDMVAVGRTMNLAAAAPLSFGEVFKSGSLIEKQNALGLIARRFHTDYVPSLHVALKSDLPVLRVQAAAVAAHVRVELRDHLHILLKDAGEAHTGDGILGARSALLQAMKIDSCVQSGLLDEEDRAAGLAVSNRLLDQALRVLDQHDNAAAALQALLSGVEHEPAGLRSQFASGHAQIEASVPVNENTDALSEGSETAGLLDSLQALELKSAFEFLLLRRGRYSAFRSLRREMPAEPADFWRVRPLGPQRAAPV